MNTNFVHVHLFIEILIKKLFVVVFVIKERKIDFSPQKKKISINLDVHGNS